MTEYGKIHTDGSRSGGQPVLLPCPFCGGRAEIAEIETEDLPLWLGECQEPPCEAVAPVRPTRDEAIAAWNTRQPTQSDVLHKTVRDKLVEFYSTGATAARMNKETPLYVFDAGADIILAAMQGQSK